MEQVIHGAQNEPFFELLHPNTNAPPRPSSYPSPQHNGHDDSHYPSQSEARALETIPPSYDFQLTRFPKPVEDKPKAEDLVPPIYKVPSLAINANNTHEHQGGYNNEQTLLRFKEGKDTYDQAIITTIETTMKNHTEKLLNVLEGVKGRLSQLENTVQGLEHSLQKRKLAEDEKQTGSDEKFLKLEHLIEDVHAKLHILQDKRELLDQTKSQLQPHITNDKVSTVQAPVPESWQQSKEEVHPHVTPSDSPQHISTRYPPQLPTQYPHPPPQQSFVAQNIPPPSMNEPKPSAQQPFPPAPQPPLPVPQSTGQPLQAQSVVPPFHFQQSTQPPLPPQGSYNPSLEASPYGHLQPHPLPPTMTPSGSYQPEAAQYASGGVYGGPPRQHPVPQEVVPSQHHVPSVSPQVYESHGRVGAGVMVPPYLQAVPPSSSPAPVYESPSGGGYGVPPYRASQPVPSAPSGGASGYPRLPTAQPVHPVLPAAMVPASAGRSPVDEVIEKVVSMGFPREQVRSVVREFTENGQSVELNVVLDKLMNGAKPQRGWFG